MGRGAGQVNAETKLSLAALNAMSEADFIASLGDIYEHAPWVARAAASARPFAGRLMLHETMAEIVRSAEPGLQLALLNAHPELGQAGKLTPDSTREQRHGGFHQLPAVEATKLAELNAAYRRKFGFPFIIAVRGQRDFTAILANLESRLANAPDEERLTAIEEVTKIAGFRLDLRLPEPVPEPEGTA